jgi:hypothetical protein
VSAERNTVFQKILDWINAHPKIKGALVVAEGAAVGTLINLFQSGSVHLTKQSLANLGVAIGGAIYLALKNYYTEQAKPATGAPASSVGSGAAKVATQITIVVACAALLLGTTACNDWERQTFQVLAASKAVIDQAQDDYETSALPRTIPVYNAINAAKDAQTLVVQSMVTYEQLKASSASSDALTKQQAIVETALVRLPALIAAVKALYSDVTKTEISPPRVQSWVWRPALLAA